MTRGPSTSRMMDDEDRYVVERRTLGHNARVRETKWCRKIDMVLWDDDADMGHPLHRAGKRAEAASGVIWAER
jgi:hypothetical protein